MISVIVPVYQVEPWLRECVDSILCQTFQDFELILVDDGSPDSCGAICDEYARLDRRVRVIHKENGGLSSARNAGLDGARGEYIAFVDSDDWIAPDMLATLYRMVQDTGADLAIGDLVKYMDGKPLADAPSPLEDECFDRDGLVQKLTGVQAWRYIIAWNKLYHRSLFDGLRFPEGFIHEDEATIHRFAARCHRVATTSRVVYYYRQVAGSITNTSFSIRRTDMLSALADRMDLAAQQGWNEMLHKTTIRYAYLFIDVYFRFSRSGNNMPYFRRMERSLKTALPYILKNRNIALRPKVYLTLVQLSPALFLWLRSKITAGGNP